MENEHASADCITTTATATATAPSYCVSATVSVGRMLPSVIITRSAPLALSSEVLYKQDLHHHYQPHSDASFIDFIF